MICYYCSDLTKSYGSDIYSVDAVFPSTLFERSILEESYISVSTSDTLDITVAGYPELVVVDISGPVSVIRPKNETELQSDFQDRILTSIRDQRDILLAKTDKYMLEDYPLKSTKESVIAYRQSLRDFPSVVDVLNVVWPTDPEA